MCELREDRFSQPRPDFRDSDGLVCPSPDRPHGGCAEPTRTRTIADLLSDAGVDPEDIPHSALNARPHRCGPAASGLPPEVVADLARDLFGDEE